jgi:hypothetical protein
VMGLRLRVIQQRTGEANERHNSGIYLAARAKRKMVFDGY